MSSSFVMENMTAAEEAQFNAALAANRARCEAQSEDARLLARQGSTIEEISEQTGLSYRSAASVYAEFERRRLTRKMRAAVMAAAGGKCRRCSSTDRLCVDHIHPLFHNGRSVLENLQVLCVPCNSGKGGRLPKVVQ